MAVPLASVEDDHPADDAVRSEEHTSELQSLRHLVCRLLLEKKRHEPLPELLDQRQELREPLGHVLERGAVHGARLLESGRGVAAEAAVRPASAAAEARHDAV